MNAVSNYFSLVEKELKIYFASPLAYIVIGLFLTVSGFFFYGIIAWFDQISLQAQSYMQAYGEQPAINVNSMAIRPFLQNLSVIALFFIPGMTMRSYTEERRQGTYELLQSSPVTNWQIALAKFTAAWLVFAIILGLTGTYQIFLFAFGNPEALPVLSGYLGLLLLGGCFIAIGMWFSAITENPLIAFVGALVANLALFSLGWISEFTGNRLAQFFRAIDPLTHFDDFSKGVFDSANFIFFLSFIFLGIFLTYMTIESARWRGSQ